MLNHFIWGFPVIENKFFLEKCGKILHKCSKFATKPPCFTFVYQSLAFWSNARTLFLSFYHFHNHKYFRWKLPLLPDLECWIVLHFLVLMIAENELCFYFWDENLNKNLLCQYWECSFFQPHSVTLAWSFQMLAYWMGCLKWIVVNTCVTSCKPQESFLQLCFHLSVVILLE